MLEKLVELGLKIQEEEQKSFVYQMILTTFLRQQGEQQLTPFMAQNMNCLTQTSVSELYRVLFAMFLPEPQLSWFLLSLCAHHPGPGSTTAI